MSKKKHFTVVVVGGPPEKMAGVLPGFDMMIAGSLVEAGFDLRVSSFDLTKLGHFSPPPVSDGYIITGSPRAVYERAPWQDGLEEQVRRWHGAGTPLLGFCFGHQLIASALGGRVEKAAYGWGLGQQIYQKRDAALSYPGLYNTLCCPVSHQDQVVVLPEGARVLYGSSFCPAGVLSYPNSGTVTTQMHPELPTAFIRDLLDFRRHNVSYEKYQQALKTLEEPSDRLALLRFMVDHSLSSARRARAA